ncbi:MULTISPECIES: stage VI sporulation protein D [Clostridia]|uniref:stage VI sporulation protein D n=1 Tax=Clostridia TaxID=186801 RepID=UPI0013147043|nr:MULTISPECIES: stage VI sporulation protein D [Clostridia]
MTNKESVFQFELNETLYFEKGQEVNEMRGVSLEPDISIHSFHDYISIRGVIELKGEYEKSSHNDFYSDVELNEMASKRYVEVVEENEDGLSIFSHRFPVEISVPANRVADLNDISVYIQTFDYEIPDPTLFRLYSTIEIHGIQQEERMVPTEEVDEEQSEGEFDDATAETDSDFREENVDHFQFELQQSELDHKSEEIEGNQSLPYLDDPNQKVMGEERLEVSEEIEKILDEERLEVSEETEKTPTVEEINKAEGQEELIEVPASTENTNEEIDETGRWKYKETKTLKEFFGTEAKENDDLDQEEMVEDEEYEWTEEEYEQEDVEASPEVNQNSDDRHNHEGVKDVGYLADMFSDKEENSYTSMRLCIVQEQDTIDSIAERYQVSALQLIKQNRLDEDYDVTEGQLLYIPQMKNKQ